MSDINAILIYIISIYKWNLFSGMVAHVCNPALQRLWQEELKFKASLGLYGKSLSQK
jgi:hypothetical protein